ncbi:MAG: TetR/AcrR family transcriptional regulator [Caulobacteraceae bacterium]|nr:TetR/AcrR family transcriptional regulator [Caulobacteraceae bacterium]
MMTDVERPIRSERKARGSGHLRRAELLAAAERIFYRVGYEGATIRKIAEEVGVSSTALYMYFQDKSEIMLEICQRALEGLQQEIDALAAENLDPVTHLRRVMELFLRFGFDQPTTYQLLYGETSKDLAERRHAVVGPLNRRSFERTQKAVEAAIASGGLRADLSPRAVTEVMVGGCHGIISMRIANPYAPWTESAALSRTLLDGLFSGFQAR